MVLTKGIHEEIVAAEYVAGSLIGQGRLLMEVMFVACCVRIA